MAVYRDDVDLQFLGRCENEDLDLLVSLIAHDPRDKTLRWTETLSGSDNYKRFYPAHRNYWQDIAAEIQHLRCQQYRQCVQRRKRRAVSGSVMRCL